MGAFVHPILRLAVDWAERTRKANKALLRLAKQVDALNTKLVRSRGRLCRQDKKILSEAQNILLRNGEVLLSERMGRLGNLAQGE